MVVVECKKKCGIECVVERDGSRRIITYCVSSESSYEYTSEQLFFVSGKGKRK